MRKRAPSPWLKRVLWVLLLAVLAGGACSPEASPPPGRPEEGYFVTTVFFATNRARTEGPEFQLAGVRGDGRLIYGLAEVSIPDSHEIGEIERPDWWQFWDRENPEDFVVVLSLKEWNRGVFVRRASELLAEVGRDDVLLFVHGYNVDFEEAARRTAQMAYDLRFSGLPAFFSWPSAGSFEGYGADETSVEWSVPHLKEFMVLLLTELGARNVHVIAHSMGNRALIRALSELDTTALPEGAATLRQVIFAAPDIDTGLFLQLAENFPGKAQRITLYSSSNDKAIVASKSFHDYSRAGGEVVVVPAVDTIDASNVRSDFLSHSYFGDSILDDIFALVQNDLPPDKRFGLRPRYGGEGVYWEFVPGER